MGCGRGLSRIAPALRNPTPSMEERPQSERDWAGSFEPSSVLLPAPGRRVPCSPLSWGRAQGTDGSRCGCSRSCDRTMHRLQRLGCPPPPGASSANGTEERPDSYRGGRGAMGGVQLRLCSISPFNCETRNGLSAGLQRTDECIRGPYQVKSARRTGFSVVLAVVYRGPKRTYVGVL